MNKIWLSCLAAAMVGSAFAQPTLGFYFPSRSIADQGISVKGWGSGTIAETDEVALEGTTSIRVSTRNYFQGGRMIFSKPIDVSKAYDDKNNLLLFAMMVPDTSTTMGGGGKGGGGTVGGGNLGSPGLGSGGQGGGAASGGLGAPGGGKGGSTGSTATTAKTAPLRTIRVIVTTTDDKKSEAYIPITTGSVGARGWRTIGVPLQAITGLSLTDKKIKEIDFSGDATGTFYLGEMKIVNDSTPLYGEPNVRELNLALGDEVTFTANGSGGSSVLKYTWDFDASDGIQIDAEGQSVKRKFRKPSPAGSPYTVTLTIYDAYGLKKPYSTTIKVIVNP